MKELFRCPCGELPERLNLSSNGQGGKYACASGDCCGYWIAKFRTNNNGLDTNECYALAVAAWNDAQKIYLAQQESEREGNYGT